jgi:quinoprotein glucose dehydrogenase
MLHRPLTLSVLISCATVLAADPPLPDGTEAATKAIAAFRVPAGMRVELFAAEPQLGSPVAICLDERGRVFVAEEYRFNRGTEENRTRPFLLDDDLQIKTVDDRLAMFRKFADKFDGGMDWFSRWSDQVRLLEDRDGDGQADRSTVFADRFNNPLDGLAAGLIARDGDVYLTCIPNLWRLRDDDDDGVADHREALLHGFGVNAAFLGHDLHGLCWGPDGRLYFSVGDRGYHVRTREGTVLSNPRRGAVFRCDPDGSHLEVIHIGLRNPQELAFDQFGNLFAADNNCDKGDHSRLVYVVEGGDSGWNMAYQTIPDPYLTGPWHAEKMWHLDETVLPPLRREGQGGLRATEIGDSPDGPPQPLLRKRGKDSAIEMPPLDLQRPAWVLPPVGKIGAGPSGFTYYPGVGLPDRYREHFFLCNYTGNGGIEAFAVKPRGASFEIDDMHDFFKPISATDCDFGYDGKLYVSDFVGLDWSGASKGGRIYTLFDPARSDEPIVRQVTRLFREGLRERTNDELAALLRHPDMRVRQRAQFALSERGEKSVAVFVRLLRPMQESSATGGLPASAKPTTTDQITRLHAVWGLWQLQRSGVAVLDHLRPLLNDGDAEVRAQAARVLGDVRDIASAPRLAALMSDPSPRVRFHAALAVASTLRNSPPLTKGGRGGASATSTSNPKRDLPSPPFVRGGEIDSKSVLNAILVLLRDNADRDPYLRHAGMLALNSVADADSLGKLVRDEDRSVRLAALLAMRQRCDVRIAEFLHDADLALVTEAARAINDLHLDDLTPALAALLPRITNTPGSFPDALVRRVINANFRLISSPLRKGGRDDELGPNGLITLAVRPNLSAAVRAEALAALEAWSNSSPRDRVTGFWRPLGQRDAAPVKQAVAENVSTLLSRTDGDLQASVVRLVAKLDIKTDDATFAAWVRDVDRPVETRIAALRLLAARKSPDVRDLLQACLADNRSQVRAESQAILAEVDPPRGLEVLDSVLRAGTSTLHERQRAFATLAAVKTPDADARLLAWAERLAQPDGVPTELVLDVLDAATVRATPELKSIVDRHQVAMQQADLMTRFRHSLSGGDPDRGRTLFFNHAIAQCVRCHAVRGTGGTAGPDLSQIGGKNPREHLLQSLIDPNAKIAAGFAPVVLVLTNGKTIAGTLKSEDAQKVVVQTPDGAVVTVPTADIDERNTGVSPMPLVRNVLSPRELRDLVEFLATLK